MPIMGLLVNSLDKRRHWAGHDPEAGVIWAGWAMHGFCKPSFVGLFCSNCKRWSRESKDSIKWFWSPGWFTPGAIYQSQENLLALRLRKHLKKIVIAVCWRDMAQGCQQRRDLSCPGVYDDITHEGWWAKHIMMLMRNQIQTRGVYQAETKDGNETQAGRTVGSVIIEKFNYVEYTTFFLSIQFLEKKKKIVLPYFKVYYTS